MTPEQSHAEETKALESLEGKISYFLRYGVFTSAFFLAVGWGGQLIRGGSHLDRFQVYAAESLKTIVTNAFQKHDYVLLSATLGLAILISLPVIRVFLTAFLFIRNRDWFLAALAIFVFAVLGVSFFLGIDI